MPTLSESFLACPSRGVYVTKPLAHWHELLEEWCLIHERYCRLVCADSIYWNNERSNVSALSGAAWRSGWAALDEFPLHKHYEEGEYKGRGDLYIKTPTTDDYIESKVLWLEDGIKPAVAKRSLQMLDEACNDVRRIVDQEENANRIGVLFAIPKVVTGRSLRIPDLLGSYFKELETSRVNAVAWCFPPLSQELIWKGKHEYAYPGVILLAELGGVVPTPAPAG